MLKSMTGFARASAANDAYGVVAEIRTVNHRYLECACGPRGVLRSRTKRIRDRAVKTLARERWTSTSTYVPSRRATRRSRSIGRS